MDATRHSPDPSRRNVLLLLGAGALAPVAVTALDAGPGRAGPSGAGTVDGLEFEVLGAGLTTLAGHRAHGAAVSAAHATSWPHVVRVDLLVRNVARLALLVSPGQFRLRVPGGVSVMPTAWRHGPTALEPGMSRHGWIEYRAPAPGGLLDLEFTPAGRAEPVTVPLLVAGAGS